MEIKSRSSLCLSNLSLFISNVSGEFVLSYNFGLKTIFLLELFSEINLLFHNDFFLILILRSNCFNITFQVVIIFSALFCHDRSTHVLQFWLPDLNVWVKLSTICRVNQGLDIDFICVDNCLGLNHRLVLLLDGVNICIFCGRVMSENRVDLNDVSDENLLGLLEWLKEHLLLLGVLWLDKTIGVSSDV